MKCILFFFLICDTYYTFLSLGKLCLRKNVTWRLLFSLFHAVDSELVVYDYSIRHLVLERACSFLSVVYLDSFSVMNVWVAVVSSVGLELTFLLVDDGLLLQSPLCSGYRVRWTDLGSTGVREHLFYNDQYKNILLD